MPRTLRELIDRASSWNRPPAARSHDLLAGSDRLMIEHGTQIYELRITRKDKLILTK